MILNKCPACGARCPPGMRPRDWWPIHKRETHGIRDFVTTYVRMPTFGEQEIGMRKMGPLAEDHPLVMDGIKCTACQQPFIKGELVTLIALGPGEDPEAQQKAREGRPYNAVATVVHWACATGEPNA